MDPAEQRKFARQQLRELRDDASSLEKKLERQVVPPDQIFDAVRRLIEHRIWDLHPVVQSVD
ncbi:MAG: hypothetical protein V3T24_03880 [Longimicrobiales bacterium]